jgi:hypothetical protein
MSRLHCRRCNRGCRLPRVLRAGLRGHGCNGEEMAPRPGTTWHRQLSGRVHTNRRAAVYDIDLFDTEARVVARLHDKSRKVICYLSAGSWESWRPDADRFPRRVKGKPNGWPASGGSTSAGCPCSSPIMRARLDLCRRKGFDGVEFDNVDGFANRTGFPLTARDQLWYNRWLARAVRTSGAYRRDSGTTWDKHADSSRASSSLSTRSASPITSAGG